MSTTDNIPFVDLGAQHAEIAGEVDAAIRSVIENTAFVGGPAVGAFERDFADYSGVANCVGVANGTDALELVLRALDIGRGDEVIVPANSFIATAEAVVRAGAELVLVDCTDDALLIDPQRVADRITSATRAAFGVDLYGQIAAFDALAEATDNQRVVLLEDAAQSQGARRHGRSIGAEVTAAATNFYPGKNLGAYGDGGAVLCEDGALAARVRAIGNHGGTTRYEHDVVGCNSRLDTMQAAVLQAKLRRLSTWNEQRRAAAANYDVMLHDVEGLRLPTTAPGNEHVWHLYVVRVPDRDRVLRELNAAGVGAGIHYPQPIHLTGAFENSGEGPGSFPVAEAAATQLLSLPIFPHITLEQQERVASVLTAAMP